MPTPRARIDLGAIAANIAILRERAPGSAVMVVVKADGYGHGAVRVAAAALAAGADSIGTATIGEALTLREGGIRSPILCWLHARDADFTAAVHKRITLAVSSREDLAAVCRAARAAATRAHIELKVDTGLNRNGARRSDWPTLIADIAAAHTAGWVELDGVFSHLALGDEPGPEAVREPRALLDEAIAIVRAHGLNPGVRHLANSAATFLHPETHLDRIRPGLAVYGLSPVPEIDDFGLRPALSLHAEVVRVFPVAAGSGVSYGHAWTAPRDTLLGLVAAGYADGVPRSLSGRLRVDIAGESYPGVGRICMDQMLIDLGDNPHNVRSGDEARLFASAEEWAAQLGTISWEILTGLHGRTTHDYVVGSPARA